MTKKLTKTKKKKPAAKTKTKTAKAVASAVYILLDRSGSMGNIWGEVVPSINQYVKDLDVGKNSPDVTLATFDSVAASDRNGKFDFHVARRNVKPAAWGNALGDIRPRGMTPLYDAIGAMTELAFADNKKRAVLVVMTDGGENDSKTVSHAQSTALVDKCKARGWEVVFMGANFNAAPQAANLNVQLSKTINIAPGFFAAGMNTMSGYTTAYAASGAAMNFTDNDRKVAGNFRTKS